MDQMRAQAVHVGTEIIEDIVTKVDLSRRPYRLETDNGLVVKAQTLIIATGAQAKWLGLESETRFKGFGVSACATCDGFFYRNKKVIVIGGGNTAVEEALYLTKFASNVTLVHRRDQLRAEPILVERLKHDPKINIVWNHAPVEILGETDPVPGVTGIRLKHTQTGEPMDLKADGVFVAIGHAPASALFLDQLPSKKAVILR